MKHIERKLIYVKNKIYGIDLGTTNSIIGCDNKLLTRLVSSKVDFYSRSIVPHYVVGKSILGSYKVDMGLGIDCEEAIDASSIVLKELCHRVLDETGNVVQDVVISVPAYFSTNQRQAVRLAAEKCGLNLINVINEPTAAAIQICGSRSTDNFRRGVFVVYDLGGGTFDCTVIDSRTGKYHVIGTDGLMLGGDDLDKAIADYVMKQANVMMMYKSKENVSKLIETCKEWKFSMQRALNEYQLDEFFKVITVPEEMKPSTEDIVLRLSDYKRIVDDTLGKTVSIVSNLIDSKIPRGTDYTLVFVGGSSYCSYLREKVESSLNLPSSKVEFDSNPDYTVALGVVKYATSLQNGSEDIEFKDVTKQLSVEDSTGKCVIIVPSNTTVPCSRSTIVTNSKDTNVLRVKLYQGNYIMAQKNEYIGYIEFDYGRFVPENFGDVEVTVSVDIGGFITLEVEDINNFGNKQQTKLKGF